MFSGAKSIGVSGGVIGSCAKTASYPLQDVNDEEAAAAEDSVVDGASDNETFYLKTESRDGNIAAQVGREEAILGMDIISAMNKQPDLEIKIDLLATAISGTYSDIDGRAKFAVSATSGLSHQIWYLRSAAERLYPTYFKLEDQVKFLASAARKLYPELEKQADYFVLIAKTTYSESEPEFKFEILSKFVAFAARELYPEPGDQAIFAAFAAREIFNPEYQVKLLVAVAKTLCPEQEGRTGFYVSAAKRLSSELGDQVKFVFSVYRELYPIPEVLGVPEGLAQFVAFAAIELCPEQEDQKGFFESVAKKLYAKLKTQDQQAFSNAIFMTSFSDTGKQTRPQSIFWTSVANILCPELKDRADFVAFALFEAYSFLQAKAEKIRLRDLETARRDERYTDPIGYANRTLHFSVAAQALHLADVIGGDLHSEDGIARYLTQAAWALHPDDSLARSSFRSTALETLGVGRGWSKD